MCHNVIITGNIKSLRKDIIKDIMKSLRFNKDGFAIVSDLMREPLRTLNKHTFLACVGKQLKNSSFIHFHMRASTSGLISVENCHLFKVWDTYMSHNGIISQLTRNPLFSDTYLFAKKLAESARFSNAKTIIKTSKKLSAWGCFLFNTINFDKVIAMSINKTTYVYYMPKTTIISNTPFELTKYGNEISPAMKVENQLIEFGIEDGMLVPQRKIDIRPSYTHSLYTINGIPKIDKELYREYARDAGWYTWL